MDSLLLSDALGVARLSFASAATATSLRLQLPCFLPFRGRTLPSLSRRIDAFDHFSDLSRSSVFARSGSTLSTDSVPPKNGEYTVGEFMTRKEALYVVKPATTIDEALETLVEKRITGFPVIDDDWKLVGLVSDYDLLALDSISAHLILRCYQKYLRLKPQWYHVKLTPHLHEAYALRLCEGGGLNDTSMFPEVDSTWKTFNEIQKLLSKTNGKVVADVMTAAPLVVHETTNLEDVARLLLETKYRRLPVVDGDGKLVGIITRGNVVRAALQIKRKTEKVG